MNRLLDRAALLGTAIIIEAGVIVQRDPPDAFASDAWQKHQTCVQCELRLKEAFWALQCANAWRPEK
jgi:hypothetical protein